LGIINNKPLFIKESEAKSQAFKIQYQRGNKNEEKSIELIIKKNFEARLH
jgi:hypothetical protein